ncbi:MAG: cyclic nucleotide-binding domain-containing protein [Candidatus Omnitrophota bacterium]
MKNFNRKKFSLGIKIIAIVLIQAFLVLDFAQAAQGDFSYPAQKEQLSTLAPQMQLDAKAVQNIFTTANQSPQKTQDFVQTKPKDSNPQTKGSGPRRIIASTILFLYLTFPFLNTLPFFNALVSIAAPVQQTQAVSITAPEMPQELAQLISKVSIEKPTDIQGSPTEEIKVIKTNIYEGRMEFTNLKARERVEQINKAINIIWQKYPQLWQSDDYITERIKATNNSPESIALGHALLLEKLIKHENVKEKNALLYIGNVDQGVAETRGSQLRWFGRPLIKISKDYIDNPFWIAFMLEHENIHAKEGIIQRLILYNILNFAKFVFSFAIPEEKEAYKAEARFTKIFGIEPLEEGGMFIHELDVMPPYYHPKTEILIKFLIFNFFTTILPLYFIGRLIIRYFQNRTGNQRNTYTENKRGTGLSSGARKSSLNIGSGRRNVRKNVRKNRYRSLILLPFLKLFEVIDPANSLAADWLSDLTSNPLFGINLAGVVFGIAAIIIIITLRKIRELRDLDDTLRFNFKGLADYWHEFVLNKLKLINENKIMDNLKRYKDNPTLEIVRGFILETITKFKENRQLIRYHNEFHINEMLDFFEKITINNNFKFLRGNRSETLIKAAIYMHDAGYFRKLKEKEFIRIGHEAKSNEMFRDFQVYLKNFILDPIDQNDFQLFSQLELKAIEHMVDMTALKTGQEEKEFDQEVADYTQAYNLLMKYQSPGAINPQDLETLKNNNFIVNKFQDNGVLLADLNNLEHRQLILDAILGGEILAMADIYGQDKSYIFRIPYLQKEFNEDRNRGDQTSPAAETMLEQVAGSYGFHQFAEKIKLNKLKLILPYLNSTPELIKARQETLKISRNIDAAINEIKSGEYIQADIDVLLDFVNQGKKDFGYDQNFSQELFDEINEFVQKGKRQKEQGIVQDLNFFQAVEKSELYQLIDQKGKDLLLKSLKVKFVDPPKSPEEEQNGAGIIINQGDSISQTGAYILLSGYVKVKKDGYRVNTLVPGAIFGEIAVINGYDRTSTVQVPHNVKVPVNLVEIPAAILKQLYSENIRLREFLDKTINTRLQELEEIEKFDKTNREIKTDEILKIIYGQDHIIKRNENAREMAQRIIDRAPVSEVMEKLEKISQGQAQEISNEELNLIIALLNSQNPLGQIINKGEKGDKIVALQVPGISETSLGIKQLNDILKYQLNTRLIQIKRDIILKLMQEQGLINDQQGRIYSTYKEDVFLINKNILLTQAKLEDLRKEFRKRIFEFIKENSIFRDRLISNNITLEEIAQFPLDFGVSEIKEASAQGRLLADINAHQAVTISKLNNSAFFSEQDYKNVIAKINILRNQLVFKTSVFDQENGAYFLKNNISDALRKNMLWSGLPLNIKEYFNNLEVNYDLAREYFSYLNIHDYIKKWSIDGDFESTADDDVFESAYERAEKILDITNQLKTIQKNQDPKLLFSQAKEYLERETKVQEFTSAHAFYNFGLKAKHPVIITLDIEKMGLMNIKSFEIDLQKISNAISEGDQEKLQMLWMSAADDVTEKLVKTMQIVKKFIIKKFDLEQYQIVEEMGGDEFSLIIDKKIETQELAHLLNVIKNYVSQEMDIGVRMAATQAIEQLRKDFENRGKIRDPLAFAVGMNTSDEMIEIIKQNYENNGEYDKVIIQNEKGDMIIYENVLLEQPVTTVDLDILEAIIGDMHPNDILKDLDLVGQAI